MAAKDIEAGRAHVVIALKDMLSRGLTNVQRKFQAWGKSFMVAGGAISAGGMAVLAPLLGAAKTFASTGAAIDDMTQRTRMSAESLSELAHAAALSDTDISTLGSSIFQMNRKIADAAISGGPLADTLADLGLSTSRLASLNPEQQFYAITDSLHSLGDESLAAAVGQEIFGGQFQSLVPLIRGGTAEIEKMRAEARALGLVMSSEDAAAAAALDDALLQITSTIKAATSQIGAALAPALTDIADRIAGLIADASAWISKNRELFVLISKIAAGVVAAGAAITGIGIAFMIAGVAISGFLAAIAAIKAIILGVAAVLAKLSIPIIIGAALAIAALASLVAAAYYYRDQLAAAFQRAREFIQPLIDGLSRIWTVFQETFGGIMTALKSGDLAAAGQIAWLGLVAVTWTAIGEIGKAANAALDYLSSWIPGVTAIKDWMSRQFGGIAKAILAGRWDIAGKIMMTKLQLVWQHGFDFCADVLDMFITGVRIAWRGIADFVVDTWSTAYNGIARGITWVMEKLGFAAEGSVNELRKMEAEQAKARKSSRDGRSDLFGGMAGRMDERDKRRRALEDEIRRLESQAAEAYDEAGAPTIEKKVADAKAALQEAIKAVEEAAEKGDDSKKDITGGMDAAGAFGRKAGSVGTFSAAAAAAVLGAQGKKAEEATAANTLAMLMELRRQRRAKEKEATA